MNRVNNLIIFVFSLFFITENAWARDPFTNFSQNVSAGSLKPFARDLGGILGSGTSHSGRSLGFSGFDVGLRWAVQGEPDRNDGILRAIGVGGFGFPWVQGEIGLPFRVDGFIRGFSYEGLTMSGGGLRYGLLRVSDAPYQPQILVSVVGNSASHVDFAATHFGGNLILSIKTPYAVTPYLGGGVDRTRLVVSRAQGDPSLQGSTTITSESRFTVGANVKLLHLGYLSAAYISLHGNPGFEMGTGVRF